MKKEYMKPEAEMMKFLETEEIMSDPTTSMDITEIPTGVERPWY